MAHMNRRKLLAVLTSLAAALPVAALAAAPEPLPGGVKYMRAKKNAEGVIEITGPFYYDRSMRSA